MQTINWDAPAYTVRITGRGYYGTQLHASTRAAYEAAKEIVKRCAVVVRDKATGARFSVRELHDATKEGSK